MRVIAYKYECIQYFVSAAGYSVYTYTHLCVCKGETMHSLACDKHESEEVS